MFVPGSLLGWLVTAIAAIGLWLAWRGVRSAPRLTRPCCARCRYDLRASLRREDAHCPECGAELAGDESVRFGRRPLRPRRVLLGALLVLPALLYVGGARLMAMTGFSWQQLRSTSSLIADLDDASGAPDAWAVLERRYMEGALGDAEIDEIIGHAVDSAGAAPTPYGSFSGQGFVTMAHLDGRVHDARFEELVDAVYAADPQIACNARVRTGQDLVLTLSPGWHVRLFGLQPVMQLSEVHLDDTMVELTGNPRRRTRTITVDAPPGPLTLRAVVDVAIVDTSDLGYLSSIDLGTPDDWPDPVRRWTVESETRLTVLPLDEYPFERVDDPALARQHVSIHRARLLPPAPEHVARRQAAPSPPQLEVEIDITPIDGIAIDYTVLVRSGATEVDVARLSTRGPQSHGCSGCRVINRDAARAGGPLRFLIGTRRITDVDAIDVVLRPNLEHAERSAIERLLDTELVFEDVELERVGD